VIRRRRRGLDPAADGRAVDDAGIAALVERIQAGEREAFAELYARCFDSVYSYLHVMLRDTHEAEDATQQVFVKAMEALPRYRPQGPPFRAWLFTIARNHALSHLRKANRVEPEDPSVLERHRDLMAAEEAPSLTGIADADLILFIERLPLAQRQVLALRFMLGLSVAETAEVLELNAGHVRTIQARALRFLRQRLTAIGREPEAHADRSHAQRTRRKAHLLRRRRYALIG
jgi:RNA polymerase sigma-70 factor (ECF subfamily)